MIGFGHGNAHICEQRVGHFRGEPDAAKRVEGVFEVGAHGGDDHRFNGHSIALGAVVVGNRGVLLHVGRVRALDEAQGGVRALEVDDNCTLLRADGVGDWELVKEDDRVGSQSGEVALGDVHPVLGDILEVARHGGDKYILVASIMPGTKRGKSGLAHVEHVHRGLLLCTAEHTRRASEIRATHKCARLGGVRKVPRRGGETMWLGLPEAVCLLRCKLIESDSTESRTLRFQRCPRVKRISVSPRLDPARCPRKAFEDGEVGAHVGVGDEGG